MVEIQTSVGELLDKISILKIKKQKINNESKLNNIEKELNSLLNTSQNLLENDPKIFNKFIEELMIINLNLWETEDEIRILESKKIFDEKFIELARNVYFKNDKRFEIKSKINNHYGSHIVEEKQYEDYS
tara:strand:+ start:182 stop:571 length:390 start_codon:yes stop_codon:yes gene_type:complete